MREAHEPGSDAVLDHGIAHAFWLREPGRGEIRPVGLPEPGPDDVLVRTVRSGVSRGTETLVFRGCVPPDQYAAMRAPFQEGDFPGPVKYGYLSVGAVEQGPPELRGRTVFCLYPHQTGYVVPADAVSVVPEGIPAARAVLAGTVRDDAGKPVAGVEVAGLDPMDGMKPAGDSPVVRGLDPERPRPLLFRQRERNLFALIDLKGTEPEPVEVRLQPTASVKGRVVGKDGKGVPGVAIHVSYEDHPVGTLLNTEKHFGKFGAPVRTDGEGRFTVTGIPGGLKVRLNGHSPKKMTLKAGEVRDVGDWKQE